MKPVNLTAVRVLVMAAMIGFIAPAEALADCPELEQLQSAYVEAQRYALRYIPWPPPPTNEACDAYQRLSEAIKAWVDYARQTGELCRFSAATVL